MPDQPQRGIFDRVLADAAEPAYGPSMTPDRLAEVVTAPIDHAMTRLRLYGKGAGNLPAPTMMQIGDAASSGVGRVMNGAQRLMDRYGSNPTPARPAAPKAPAWADDRNASGVAVMKPGGYY